MNREFLKGLGLEDDAIDKIMAEHGQTVNPLKKDLKDVEGERDRLKGQLDDRDDQLEKLGDKAKGDEEWEQEISALKKANEDKIKQIKFDYELDKALVSEKARNTIAVKALLDLDAIKLDEDGKLIGLSDQLDSKKESDWYLFDIENNSDNNTDTNTDNNSNSNTDNNSNTNSNSNSNTNTHIPGQHQRTNSPKDVNPYEKGKLKALERFKKEEAE